MQTREIIRRKRDGETLDGGSIATLVRGMADGSTGDEQLGAFAMAVFLNGMDDAECVALTECMRDSGQVMTWDDPSLPGPVLDKHSTGGIGDVTSLLVAPIVAACGGFVPMIAGRGLGHTGGTVDKLAAIPGYRVDLSPDAFRKTVRQLGCAIIGQTGELAPADRRLYAVRDTTATVESIPLIVASILSKKLAEGLDGLVLDVKTGNGAVMSDAARARQLAERLCEVGAGAGVRTHALLSDMSQPLAGTAGNSLEILEVIECLVSPGRDRALVELSVDLAAEMLRAGSLAPDLGSARAQAWAALESGRAAERFGAMVAELGGPSDLLERPESHFEAAPVRFDVYAESAGQVSRIDVRALGLAVVDLGGGRRKANDDIDPSVGLSGLRRLGDAVDRERPLATVHARTDASAQQAADTILAAYRIGDTPSDSPVLISARLAPGAR